MLSPKSLYIRFYGISESRLNRVLGSILGSRINYFIKTDRFELVLEICGSDPLIKAAKQRIADRLGSALIGYGKANSLELIVGNQLIKQHLSITGAESLTAGMFQSILGNVPGISAVFPGGFVTYSNHAKHQLLGIPRRVINTYGVVSKPVAKWMAERSRKIMGTDLSVSFTGVAGPASLENHPAGTVWIGLSVKDQPTRAHLYHLASLYHALAGFRSKSQVKANSRNAIRLLSVKTGLKMVYDDLNH